MPAGFLYFLLYPTVQMYFRNCTQAIISTTIYLFTIFLQNQKLARILEYLMIVSPRGQCKVLLQLYKHHVSFRFIMSTLLFDKVALITGASRGVGYAAARKLCEKFPGATIYLATKNQNITPELNKKMQEDFPGASEHCEYVNLDVRDEESVEKVRDMIRWRIELLL